ncbi:MAG: hypothetical protein IJ909_08165, partial [Fibrobacter sp.]|nr:hypothetical protein [Fibrobacter sp.]
MLPVGSPYFPNRAPVAYYGFSPYGSNRLSRRLPLLYHGILREGSRTFLVYSYGVLPYGFPRRLPVLSNGLSRMAPVFSMGGLCGVSGEGTGMVGARDFLFF